MRNTDYITTLEKQARMGNIGFAKEVVRCSEDLRYPNHPSCGCHQKLIHLNNNTYLKTNKCILATSQKLAVGLTSPNIPAQKKPLRP